MLTAIEFGHFRIPLHRRELLAEGCPMELGARVREACSVALRGPARLIAASNCANSPLVAAATSARQSESCASCSGNRAECRNLLTTRYGALAFVVSIRAPPSAHRTRRLQHTSQKFAGAVMLGSAQDLGWRATLGDHALVHEHDFVGDFSGEAD